CYTSLCFSTLPRPPTSTLFPYTTLFRSVVFGDGEQTRDFTFVDNAVYANLLAWEAPNAAGKVFNVGCGVRISLNQVLAALREIRSEEHTSELQSRFDLVCRLLLEKKKNK